MRVRFLLGPAGAGKTSRCLSDIRRELAAHPSGPTLLLVAPKQSTYQLERQLLETEELSGYTRLRVVSLERLARFVFSAFGKPVPDMLDEDGRVMVLRSLLSRKRNELKLFRASARLPGLAAQFSAALAEMQRNGLTPETLRSLSNQLAAQEALSGKLSDLALILEGYGDWLKSRQLLDADALLDSAIQLLEGGPGEIAVAAGLASSGKKLELAERMWVDGFTEWSPREARLVAMVASYCRETTVTFCLGTAKPPKTWLSHWSVAHESYEMCRKTFDECGCKDIVESTLKPAPGEGRFRVSPELACLERSWADADPDAASAKPAGAVRLVSCATPEAEAVFAAREILKYVRDGGRFREVTVLARSLETHHACLERVLTRYEIPHFIDRRESVAHHPLAELTRSALRVICMGWQQDDLFAALKTGLFPLNETEIDRLENESLARGWQGSVWEHPIVLPDDPELTTWIRDLHKRGLPALKELGRKLRVHDLKPTGTALAEALRSLWDDLDVQQTLQDWASSAPEDGQGLPAAVHETVWRQALSWLENLELAFAEDRLSLREWLPVIDAGLGALTVGVIPPALDQVMVGTIDRSRNPEVKVAFVLGANEGLFPAPPPTPALLTDADRVALEKSQLRLGGTARWHLGREQYLGYLACTRAGERLVITSARQDAEGSPLNVSPFLWRIRRVLPGLTTEEEPAERPFTQAEHWCELLVPILSLSQKHPGTWRECIASPALENICERLANFNPVPEKEKLAPDTVARLYRNTLPTSVSRLENFAACPFRFFVHSGLRAEERRRFEVDSREQGSFQHEVLALFHQELTREGRRWRDLTPKEARTRVARLAQALAIGYRDGLLQTSSQTKFLAATLTGSLQDFVGTLVEWMREQYRFEPRAVELAFGEESAAPWVVDLGNGRHLELRGRIDRLDLFTDPESGCTYAIVLDYKSSHKELDNVLVKHGLQLQLLSYLNVIRRWPPDSALNLFGVDRLEPAGVFYVSLRGRYDREANRGDALKDPDSARKNAYKHCGRFDTTVLSMLDARQNQPGGDQFNYKRNKDGTVSKVCKEPLARDDFKALLDGTEAHLRHMGTQIYSGNIDISPFKKGQLTACSQCAYQPICRMDPWTQSFRILTAAAEKKAPEKDTSAIQA